MSKRKLKPVLPSLKEKKRYVAFRVISPKKVQRQDVIHTIEDTLTSSLGWFGRAQAGAWLVSDSWDDSSQSGLIRVNHRFVDQIKGSLTFINSITESPVLVRSIGVSGILKKANAKRQQKG